MSTTPTDLRSQIIDNWLFHSPEAGDLVVVTTYDGHLSHTAAIVKKRSWIESVPAVIKEVQAASREQALLGLLEESSLAVGSTFAHWREG